MENKRYMSKSIAFLTLDWAVGTNPLEPNGCAWYRCYLPMLELEKRGWDVAMAPPEYHYKHGFGAFYSDEEVEFGWDIVVLKLIMMKSAADILENKELFKQKVVVDIDDFYEGLTESNIAYHTTNPEKNENMNREHYWRIIEAADYLITSTQFLYDFYTKEKGFTNVFLVRNAIDIDRWTRRSDHSRGLPTIGWVGATPWRSGDLETLNPWFGSFLENNHLSFHHSGHIESKKIPTAMQQLGIFPSTKVTKQERMILSKYPQLFRKFDIGIVPLNNIPFNHAKSTIKGLEYVAAGIPFISSESPEYCFLESQGIGRVAKSEDEWAEHLEDLMSPKTRKEEIEKNYETLKSLHTMEVRGEEWDKVFTTILDS
jgi:hypothetical protein